MKSSTKTLDAIRYVLAIFMAVTGSIMLVLGIMWTAQAFGADYEDGFSGLVFLFIIPAIIYGIVYICLAIKGIRKNINNRDVLLIDRRTSSIGTIIKGAISVFILTAFCLPVVIYYLCDLREADKKRIALKAIETNSQSSPKMENVVAGSLCWECGKAIDADAKFCKHCGKEIK